jgi:SMODS and SLOG-associating 2TM effector domain 1
MPPVMDGALADDDGLSPLDPDRYLEIRVANQLSYYRLKTVGLERKLRRLQLLILLAGGAGALVAAAGAELWVGLATAVAAAAAAHLAYLQVESTLVTYNQAAARLDDLQARWLAAPSPDRDGRRFDQLVEDAEAAVETELSGWVLQMTKALERQGSHPEREDH